MAPAQSTLRHAVREQYARPLIAHYLAHRRRYSNLLMVAFSAYVLQNVGRIYSLHSDGYTDASIPPSRRTPV